MIFALLPPNQLSKNNIPAECIYKKKYDSQNYDIGESRRRKYF